MHKGSMKNPKQLLRTGPIVFSDYSQGMPACGCIPEDRCQLKEGSLQKTDDRAR
jgi:hypothetical protein